MYPNLNQYTENLKQKLIDDLIATKAIWSHQSIRQIAFNRIEKDYIYFFGDRIFVLEDDPFQFGLNSQIITQEAPIDMILNFYKSNTPVSVEQVSDKFLKLNKLSEKNKGSFKYEQGMEAIKEVYARFSLQNDIEKNQNTTHLKI